MTPERKLSCEFYEFFQNLFSAELLWMAASKSLWNTWTLVLALFFLQENITLKNYLIIFKHVDKSSRKNIYLRKILDLDLKVFGQRIWITLNFTGFGWKYFEQRFTITILDTLLAIDLKILELRIWITIIIFTGFWFWKYLDYWFWFWLLFILLDLNLKILGLRIWIIIIRFC